MARTHDSCKSTSRRNNSSSGTSSASASEESVDEPRQRIQYNQVVKEMCKQKKNGVSHRAVTKEFMRIVPSMKKARAEKWAKEVLTRMKRQGYLVKSSNGLYRLATPEHRRSVKRRSERLAEAKKEARRKTNRRKSIAAAKRRRSMMRS